MRYLAALFVLITGLATQAHAQPFYKGNTYLNKSLLNDASPAITINIGGETPPDHGIFANIALTQPEAVPFFDKLYPRIKEKLLNTRKYAFFLRPRMSDRNGALLFGVAYCADAAAADKISFIADMVQTGATNQWTKRHDPSAYLIQQAEKALHVDSGSIRACLKGGAVFTELNAYEQKAASKLYRSAPFPPSHLFLNEHFFPGIYDKAAMRDTFMRAAKKVANRQAPLTRSQKDVLEVKPFDTLLGNENAPIQIVRYDTPEFIALWRFYSNVLPVLQREYIDKGLVNFRLRPYPWFEDGTVAASVSLCLPPEKRLAYLAGISQQAGKWQSSDGFWESNPDAHDLFFDFAKTQARSGSSKEFASCIHRYDEQSAIQQIKMEVNREFDYFYSPTIFINDVEYTRHLGLAEMRTVLEDMLGKLKAPRR